MGAVKGVKGTSSDCYAGQHHTKGVRAPVNSQGFWWHVPASTDGIRGPSPPKEGGARGGAAPGEGAGEVEGEPLAEGPVELAPQGVQEEVHLVQQQHPAGGA